MSLSIGLHGAQSASTTSWCAAGGAPALLIGRRSFELFFLSSVKILQPGDGDELGLCWFELSRIGKKRVRKEIRRRAPARALRGGFYSSPPPL